ncbi:MAG: hypothetical protein JSS87_15220 [Acidobacteria bacterium]|nr:hypothetical protein [Acidobacteriota bacterium]
MSTTFRAVVTDIRLHSQQKERSRWQIALDHTEFCPGDTGLLRATSKSGAVLEVAVLEVEEDAGELWHATEKPLLAETEVEAIITSER